MFTLQMFSPQVIHLVSENPQIIYPGNGRSSFLYFESHFDHVRGFVHIETLKALNLLDVIRLILVASKNAKVSGTLLGLM